MLNFFVSFLTIKYFILLSICKSFRLVNGPCNPELHKASFNNLCEPVELKYVHYYIQEYSDVGRYMLFLWVSCPERFVSIAAIWEHLPEDHVVVEGDTEEKEGDEKAPAVESVGK